MEKLNGFCPEKLLPSQASMLTSDEIWGSEVPGKIGD